MHEWTIAESLIKQVVKIGQKGNLKNISRVAIKVGVLRQVVNETLVEAFRQMAEDTIARGANLTIETVPFKIKCRGCGEIRDGGKCAGPCPACGSREVNIVSGRELYLDYLEGETGNEKQKEGDAACG